ncbi:MAG: CBS domain-containing protein [Chloroflexi bacterium]|nr:CBS domain-containing protein [Chloroflexota bacterium]
MKISNILATKGNNVVTIQQDQTIKEAVGLLASRKIGALVVLDAAGQLAGILSERDIVRIAAAQAEPFSARVSQAMTNVVVTGTPNDDLKSVLQTMTEKRFRHLPILENGKLIGIISIGDLVKAQLDEYEGEIDSLQTHIAKG